ncbi:hypothetical protein D3C72_1492400 [compost metagenome]
MRQLVEHEARQLALGVADEGGQQRIAAGPVHPAQRGIRRHGVHGHFEAIRLLRLGLGFRGGFVVVAAVTHAARDREAPALERERVRRRGHHVPHGGGAMQVGIRGVARVVGQAEFARCETADALREFELGLERRAHGRIGQPFGHGLGRAQDVEVAVGRLPVVAEVGAARQEKRAGQCQRGRAQPSHHAFSTCTRQS